VVRRGCQRRARRPRQRRPPCGDRARLRAPVLIDARAAARPELGGVERWARELSARLPALAPGRYAVARPPAALSHRAGHAWEQGWLPLAARRAEWLLCPANLAPLAASNTALVIHDAAALREPGWYSGLYVRWQRFVLPRIARRARQVITVSEFSRRELAELLGVDAVVVPGGVDERFDPDADAAAARSALGLERPYVLTVASRIARKNLGALECSARRLRGAGMELVAAGGDRPQFRDGDDTGSAVRSLGHVPDEHLPGLYAGALCFVLPSLYEGFGLPCLEAMACGTPVVASDAAALPETCGGAALLVDPRDPVAIADAVERAAGDEQLAAAGIARAQAFTWDCAASRVDGVLCAAGG
jgi:glycosyltransferase involved in cell wall biosynthesis